MSVCNGCSALHRNECGEPYGCGFGLWDHGQWPGRPKDRPHEPPQGCQAGDELKKYHANPIAGRLVFVPWSAGSKVIPKLKQHDGEDTHGGRC